MTVRTRFAPSPTGFLHIGNARTALFNYLFAKHNDGKFLLRVEDTDKARSTQAAIDEIINGLDRLGLKPDEEIVYQSKNEERHKEIAHKLLAEGKAYKCYCTANELAEMRKAAEAEGKRFKYPKIWRDKQAEGEDASKPYSIRIKAPLEGELTINDLVQGEVKYPANELDDMIILRTDGSPTYLLAVVADDYDMEISHIIRGDDHLTNSFRQKVIFDALGWQMPKTAHIPLIHGADGAKLSKRHGATAVSDYFSKLGYISDALVNYLMSLGWSYGDEDKISLNHAIAKFDLKNVGKSPSRFDFDKLNHINFLYLQEEDNQKTYEKLEKFLTEKYGEILDDKKQSIIKLLPALKERANNYIELAGKAGFVIERLEYNEKAQKMLDKGREHLPALTQELQNLDNWNIDAIQKLISDFGSNSELKPGMYMPALRVAVCGTMEAPGLNEVIAALGKEEVLKRLKNY